MGLGLIEKNQRRPYRSVGLNPRTHPWSDVVSLNALPQPSLAHLRFPRIKHSTDQTDALRPLIQQQWNFSPTGTIIQIEDHKVNLYGVWMLQLIIRPVINRGPAVATMASWRLA
jgi:hypothetical protein